MNILENKLFHSAKYFCARFTSITFVKKSIQVTTSDCGRYSNMVAFALNERGMEADAVKSFQTQMSVHRIPVKVN